MVNPKVGLAAAVLGVSVVLLPILSLFLTGGFESPIQRFYDSQIAPGLPMGLVVTAAGAALTAVGLIVFIRGMRSMSPYQSPMLPVRRPTPGPKQPDRELEQIEREISTLLEEGEPAMEIRTVKPRPVETASQKQQTVIKPSKPVAEKTVKVVTEGVDMVCQSCGAVNPLGSKICSSCGVELFKPDPKGVPCPVCGAPLDENYKIGENIVCKICFSELVYQTPS